MRIGLTGASGFLGREIIRQAVSEGDQIVAYSRSPAKAVPGVMRTELFGAGMPVNHLDTMLHLAGESLFGFWTKRRRTRIWQSRVEGTRSVVEAMQRTPDRPQSLICASGISIYGDRGEDRLTEESAIANSGFLRDVAVAWESEAMRAANFGVRVVTIRIAMVLGRQGGALSLMAPIFSIGLGGYLGSGRQWTPWIHVEDVARVFLHAAREKSLVGPVNAVSPSPLRNQDFIQVLGKALRRPAFFAVPRFALQAILREQAALLLDSQHALPKRVLETGFRFHFPGLEEALRDLLPGR